MAKPSGREFLLGVLWAAWVLHRFHGEDTYAEALIRDTASVETFRRLARAEEYDFKRGFWADCARRQQRERASEGSR